jgi:hypothetical protein
MKHSEANQVIRSAFQKVVGRAPTDQEAAYCQAVAWLETFYGRGGQFAALFAKGLVNWGALERGRDASGSCPDGTASGQDVGGVCFYVFPSDADAAFAFLTVLLTGNRTPGKAPVQQKMIDAMTGSPQDVAAAMKSFGYFGAPVDQYAQAIATSLNVNAQPGGITDQGVRFSTPDPPAGTPPQVGPGQKPGDAKPWYRRTPVLVAGGLAAAFGVAAAVRAVR